VWIVIGCFPKNGGDGLLPHYTVLQLKHQIKLSLFAASWFIFYAVVIKLWHVYHKCHIRSVHKSTVAEATDPSLGARSVKISQISGRMTVQFDNNCADQTKVYGWVEWFVGRWTRVEPRSGGLMAVTCVDVKGTDTSAHEGEQCISITFILPWWGFKFIAHCLYKW
jgi:hypothetical protein